VVLDLVGFVWDKEELPEQWEESVIVPVYQKGEELLVVVVVEAYNCYQLHGKILSNIFLCRLTPYVGKIGIIGVNFDMIGQECMSLVRLVLGACKKKNIYVVDMHLRLTMNGILKDFLKKGHF
jgi:hypothetical protein